MIPWLVSAAALVGVVLNIRKRRECFAIWTLTNASWCVIDWQHGLFAQAALMSIYCILSLWGLWAWSRDTRSQRKEGRIK